MRKQFSLKAAAQAGFTLIELVIVIVIIGILAAVAIPKLTSVSDSAHKATNKAILGMVKSAWSAAYAVNKDVPTAAQIVAQTSEPLCTAPSTTSISCPTAWTSAATPGTALLITYGTTASSLVCTTTADCD